MHWGNSAAPVNEELTTHFDFGTIAYRYNAWYRSARGAMYDRLEKGTIDRLLPVASAGQSFLEIGRETGHFSAQSGALGFITRVERIQIKRMETKRRWQQRLICEPKYDGSICRYNNRCRNPIRDPVVYSAASALCCL